MGGGSTSKWFEWGNYEPEGKFLGVDWSSGDKKEQKAREATKANEAAAVEAQAKAVQDAKDAPNIAAAAAAEQLLNRKRAIIRSRSVYTSPLGVQTEATTARKTLLGQ